MQLIKVAILLCCTTFCSTLSSKKVIKKDALDHSVNVICAATLATVSGALLENVFTELRQQDDTSQGSFLYKLYTSQPAELLRFVIFATGLVKGLQLIRRDSYSARAFTMPTTYLDTRGALATSFALSYFFIAAGYYMYQDFKKMVQNSSSSAVKKYAPLAMLSVFEVSGLLFIDHSFGSLVMLIRSWLAYNRVPTRIQYVSSLCFTAFALAVHQHTVL